VRGGASVRDDRSDYDTTSMISEGSTNMGVFKSKSVALT